MINSFFSVFVLITCFACYTWLWPLPLPLPPSTALLGFGIWRFAASSSAVYNLLIVLRTWTPLSSPFLFWFATSCSKRVACRFVVWALVGVGAWLGGLNTFLLQLPALFLLLLLRCTWPSSFNGMTPCASAWRDERFQVWGKILDTFGDTIPKRLIPSRCYEVGADVS